jgi:hypothetical protein
MSLLLNLRSGSKRFDGVVVEISLREFFSHVNLAYTAREHSLVSIPPGTCAVICNKKPEN